MKELHKSKGQQKENDYSNYELFLQEGIKKHLWLENFHKKYGTAIQSGTYPFLSKKDLEDAWKVNFAEFEVARYKYTQPFGTLQRLNFTFEMTFFVGKSTE